MSKTYHEERILSARKQGYIISCYLNVLSFHLVIQGRPSSMPISTHPKLPKRFASIQTPCYAFIVKIKHVGIILCAKAKASGKLEPALLTTMSLELERSAGEASALFEEELLAAAALSERRALERLTTRIWIVRIITSIEARFEFGIFEDFVSLVDLRGFRLGFFFRQAVHGDFVWMILLRQSAIGPLDFALVGVARDTKDFVVVFLFGAAEERVGFLNQLRDSLLGAVVFFGVVEG
jgi:hypothetical protein